MRAFSYVSIAIVVVVAIGVGLVAAGGTSVQRVLNDAGIADVGFGEPKPVAVMQLTRLLGQPTGSQTSSGCGPRYSEVEWGDLAAEFRLSVFSGYRYLEGGLLGDFGTVARLEALPVVPRLATTGGITLGSSLGQVKAVFGPLRPVGTDRSEAGNGLIFYDDAAHFPDPPSSRIVEIKLGTCGDY